LQQQYKTFDDFRQHFEVPQSLIDHIKAEGEKQNIKPKDDAELEATQPYLRTQLKALIARDLWNMDEYYAIINDLNDTVQRALKLIKH
jgi:carboxyl-terminal processing protease